ncbi:MAG: HNH endonuclease [Kouleothrix sp.]|jgi:hypothetical protein|nr:HNH endonuclease [Kouleothrix sp.]
MSSIRYWLATHPRNPYWRWLRQRAVARQRGRCAVCGRRLGRRFQAHHLTYARLGHEWLSDIQAVHPRCHPIADARRRSRQN